MPVHPGNNADSPPHADDTAAQLTRSPRSVVDAAKLRETLARITQAMRPAAVTPTMDFGRFVRQELDRSPDRVEGMFAMARLLKCDPIGREIESLKRDVADLKTGPRPAHPSAPRRSRGRQGPKPAGGGKTKAAGKTNKRTTRDQASKLLRQLEKQVLQEVQDELGRPSEAVIRGEMVERVFSKSDTELTLLLHERFNFPLCGRKTLYRTDEYTSWASYRSRGNSRRLDPESPAIDATAAGGESPKSGATRNASYVAENGLSEGRFGRIPPLDAEGLRRINDDPKARAFKLSHPELYGEDVDLCG
jgi:hypothetical protein